MSKSQNKLAGLRILNTRPLEQSLLLSQAICDAGGRSIDLPTLAIEPTANDWFNSLPNLASIKHSIFISTNAVNFFFKPLEQRNVAWPISIQNTVVGKATAATLAKWKVRIDNIPTIGDSEHLLQLDALQKVKNQTILLVKGEGGRMDITDTLLSRGANLSSLTVYRRVLPNISPQLPQSLWHDDAVDIILFTSQQAIHNIFTMFGKDAHSWICNKPCLVISERLKETAYQFGIRTIIVSSYDTILNTLEHYNQGLTDDQQR